MPELPEVETIKNTLLPIVKNRKILSIDVFRKETILSGSEKFKNALINQTFLNVTRKGKFLIFHLTNNLVFLSHLRMEGKYYDLLEEEDDSKYAKVVFHLDNNHKLVYDDSRCFGIMILTSEDNYLKEKEISKLGKEPFEIEDVSYLLKACKNKRLPIKTTLLDQSLISGLGNIYVDETLYASKIHPLTPAYLLNKKDWENIVNNAKEILTTAISLGGSTIKSYHPGKGIDGNFQTRIKIYGKEGETCPNCHKMFRFIKVGGRGTTFCPSCQIKLGSPINVAITGKVGTGKSEILRCFKEKGYDILSSDEVVARLYEDENITAKIEKLLKISFKQNTVNKDALRNHLLINKCDKKKLERFIHPLVEKEIIKFLNSSKSKIKVVEVPLLFESGLDHYFDTIIAPKVSEEKQSEILNKRNPTTGLFLKEINSTSKFDEYISKVEFVIDNNDTKEKYIKKIFQVIKEIESRL